MIGFPPLKFEFKRKENDEKILFTDSNNDSRARFKLLGVNYAYYTAKNDGVVTLPTPNPVTLPVESRIPNNTAFVIKASRIKELETLIQGVR